MGLDSVEGLRSFCLELSSDRPSPGGGTASAAAGAMAASLLVMVCGITARSKKYAASAPELIRIGEVLEVERDGLIRLALWDARAYDSVMNAARKKKAEPGNETVSKEMDDALKRAAEVPLDTAAACVRILDHATKVANLGARSASSDVGVAILLAEAGLKGASKNVRINLDSIMDGTYVDHMVDKLRLLETEGRGLASNATSQLTKP